MQEYRIVKFNRLGIIWTQTWGGKSVPSTKPVSYYQGQVKRILSEIDKVHTWDNITDESEYRKLVEVQIEQYDYELANPPIMIPYIIGEK